jgi:nucleoside-diphosphate-sugar epimerase
MNNGMNAAIKNRSTELFSNFNKKRILITGSSGYIASGIIRQLVQYDCTMICTGRNDKLKHINGSAKIETVDFDVTNRKGWPGLLIGVDYVFHLAAQTSLSVAESDPVVDLNSNVLPMVYLLQSCRALHIRPVILFAGTATEVGVPSACPINEDVADEPATVYDLNKLTAEKYLRLFASQGFVYGATLRLANVYGPGAESTRPDRGILNRMIKKALAGEYLTVYGDGNYVRDYVFIDDVARAFLLAALRIENTNSRNFLIGSGSGIRLAQAFNLVADLVAKKTGRRVAVTHVPEPNDIMAIEKRNFVAETRRFSEATGWSPLVSFEDGIRRTVEFMS